MNVCLVGAGPAVVPVQLALQRAGQRVVATLEMLTDPGLKTLLGFQGVVVIPRGLPPGGTVAARTMETLQALVAEGVAVVVVAAPGDPFLAWAQGLGLPALPDPPTEADLLRLTDLLARAERGEFVAAAARRAAVGELAEVGTTDVSVLTVTGPKGGTGKTTVAVNLAVLAALCGLEVYLLDADAHGGSVHHHLFPQTEDYATLVGVLRSRAPQKVGGLAGFGAGAGVLTAFTPAPGLPQLRVLYGVAADQLADPLLQDTERLEAFVADLVRAVGGRGLLLIDVGINAAIPLHAAVLRHTQGLVVVIRAEPPDLEQTAYWFRQILAGALRAGAQADLGRLLARLKVAYNAVDPQAHAGAEVQRLHRDLGERLEEMLRDIGAYAGVGLAPSLVLPAVPARYLTAAMREARVEATVVMRFARAPQECPELAPFVAGLVGLLGAFVRQIPEAAARRGLLAAGAAPRRGGLLGRLFGRGTMVYA
jgi:MinD-like ATPase involved in chromosome partitioning or flagellar assembly